MNVDSLSIFNPWWNDKPDPHISILSKSRFKIIPSWIKEISLEPRFLNVVSGPKCVGKTTGVKLLILSLLKKVDVMDILYVNCEAFLDAVSMRIAIEEYLKGHKEAHVFIDEISALNDAWNILKGLIDSDLIKYSSITLITSNAQILSEISQKNREIKNVNVMPLNFPEFLEIHGIKNYKTRYEEVLKLFEKYLKMGGFLGAINGHSLENIIREYVTDIIRASKNPSIMREIIAALLNKMPAPISFRGIAKQVQRYSYKLVQEYLEVLRGLYVIDYAYMKEGREIYYKRERKVFFRDPLLMRIFSFLSGIRPFESVIYENVVQEHLYRKFGKIYYYKDLYEIDVIAGELKLGIKARKTKTKYPRGVIVLDKEDIPEFLLKLFR